MQRVSQIKHGLYLCACVAFLAAGFLLHVSAHGLEEKDTVVVGGMGSCLNLVTQTERLSCYAKLCTPDYACAQSLLKSAVEAGGPAKGIEVMHDLMDAKQTYAIASDGHELAHVVGRQAAKHFGLSGDIFVQCPRDYFYGCGHGFFEIALALADSQSGAALEVCGTLPVGQRFVCYHGVGHGLMMSHGNRLDESLTVCNQLPASEQADQGCWQGVFMENVNTYIRRENLPDVFDENDPLAPCSRVDVKYNRECYLNQAAVLVMMSGNSVEKASEACLKAGPTGIEPCIEGLGQFTTSPGWQEILSGKNYTEETFLPIALELCKKFPAGHVVGCEAAAAGNLINYDSPDKALRFCMMLDDIGKDACLKKVVQEINRPIVTDAMRAHVCDQLSPAYKSLCASAVPSGAVSSAAALKSVEGTSLADDVWRSIVWFFRILTTPFRFIAGLFQSDPPAVPVVAEPQPLRDPPPLPPLQTGLVIHYAGDAFTPNVFTVAIGETVTFVNDGDDYLWPASDNHPTHEVYAAFDAKRAVTKTKPWSFTFDQRGTWAFHNHLSPTATGSVTVR